MAEIDRYRADDRRNVDALYRRVFGPDAAEANRLRWDWQYRRNPNVPSDGPLIWLAREGTTIVGQYAAMPVKVLISGREIDAAWGMDVMVAPERQRQGLGDVLFRTWDRNVGASLGLGLSDASYKLFQKLQWPDVGPVPCMVKPLSRRALRRPSWPAALNGIVSYVTLPWIRLVSRARPLLGEVKVTRQFDESFTRLWDRVGAQFGFAVRRDAAYLNWKYVQAPHVRYQIAVLRRGDDAAGYAVYRHVQEPRGRVTLLVDFLADPTDGEAVTTLLRWIDREARAADSDKIRTFAMHDGFRKLLRKSGYYAVKSTMEFVVKINAIDLPAAFYEATDTWHVTLGDSDQDPMSGAARPALLVAIDTEGDNQWDAQARRHQTFANIHQLDRLHEFFTRHGVRPTYVITYPVARDPRSAEVLRALLARGDCEVGAHHHAWETPPCDPADIDRHPYALSLPLSQFDAQLASLTSAITGAVGVAPVSYRSGRFGFSASHVSSLERAGYLVDSSVAPLFYEAHKQGPDFVGAPLSPYFLAYDDATRAGTSGVLELPITAALNRRVPALVERLYARAPSNYTTKRVLRLLKIAKVRWLRPSYSSAEEMISLARQVALRGEPLLNLLFHSSEVMVGGSPYNKTDGELNAFYDRLGRALTYMTKDLGAAPMTFAEFHAHHAHLPRLAASSA